MHQHLTLHHDGPVATITLDRPAVFNALNNDIKTELRSVFEALHENTEVRAVVLTGAGNAFCSGQDLKAAQTEMDGKPYSEAIRTYYNPLILAMRQLNKPIICRLNGIAAGAGCSLALACDIIVASEEAYLSELFIGIGLIMDSGSTHFLPRIVGRLKAFELATMGTRVGASEALLLGLVNEVVPHAQLDAAVQRYVDHYANAPTVAVAVIKEMLNQAGQLSLEEMLELEAKNQDIAATTADHAEGIRAFTEKRKPIFNGK
jgi:2-(1,2-epoxy-1,2-dihydrophenyl)acetyl-CoA isomerase